MKVEVTQEHIDHGIRGSCTACPISLAIADTPNITRVSTRLEYTRITIGEEVHTYILPPKASQFIVGFDNGYISYPFTFIMRRTESHD